MYFVNVCFGSGAISASGKSGLPEHMRRRRISRLADCAAWDFYGGNENDV